MNRYDERGYVSKTRASRYEAQYTNKNEDNILARQLPDYSRMQAKETSHYCRKYVRFRKSSSRSRSRKNFKAVKTTYTSNDYRRKIILMILQIIAFLHICSIIYFHQRQLSFTTKYTIITFVMFNILTYFCVHYDTQQAENGDLLLGESSILFLLWYGGIIGGGLALLTEKHKHLRSRSFTYGLKLTFVFNATWLFIAYILYPYRNQLRFTENSGTYRSPLETLHKS